MSAGAALACRGAPRDLGYDQGAALRGAIRTELEHACGGALGRVLLPLRRGEAERAFARAVRRHQPHVHERLEGMARGAGVPVAALLRLLARDLHALPVGGVPASAAPGEAVALAAGGEGTGGGALLGLAAPFAALDRAVLRRTAPEAGFAGLEATLPWLPLALAGANERGLAALWLPGARAEDAGRADGAASAEAPPPALLAQECLESLGGVEESIERCERRAAHGHATLLFADAAGAVAAVAFAGGERRVLRPESGLLALPAGHAGAASLAKRAAASSALDAEALGALLGERAEGSPEAPALCLVAAGAGRPELSLARGGRSADPTFRAAPAPRVLGCVRS